ncbi:hypothetical protein PHAVU_009G219400 [Phaseolus vulgaris]|uniref:Uncharacterized protein n=1 Tax=Phaseolus vulgaris TaxID=3885 RepID=V7AZ21_PHAVU|nr:hypothetical protein PHAVU_009G219400g [Phaseolus vulgaris]ESW10550.1 hypothetical protein PHAVU_009G219400g [Phaseolus vulgaris]
MMKRNDKDMNRKKGTENRRGKKFEETAKKNFHFDALSFTVCNVSHVTSHHLPLIIPCLLISPTICLSSEFHGIGSIEDLVLNLLQGLKRSWG